MPIKYDDKGLIKRPDKKINYTQEMIVEWAQCIQDVLYFAEHYYYVVHQVEGQQKIVLRDYQKELIKNFQNQKLNICLAPRQCGKTTCSAIYLLWFACFQKDKTIAILANKAATAKSILEEIKFAYEKLPEWLKPGVKEYNALSIEFDNGCKIIARATSKDALRGESCALIFCDEFAFLQPHIADEFWASNLPTISTGGACIIVSTPNGTGNLFYSLWKDASDGKSDFPFKPYKIDWRQVPGRDEKWEREMRMMIGDMRFNQEFNCLRGDSYINIRCKRTGKIKQVLLKELYEKGTNIL